MPNQRSKRQPIQSRKFILRDERVRENAIALIRNLPVDLLRPVEVIAREYKAQRSLDQNNLYYALVTEISQQAWIEGRQYGVEVLHEYLKRSLLPEDESLDPDDVRDSYRKWEFDPAGERVLVGSTTMLTVRGFNNFITAVEAFGASLGVMFKTKG